MGFVLVSSGIGSAWGGDGGGAGEEPDACTACRAGTVRCNEIVNGALQDSDCRLDDGSFFDVWRFDLATAQSVEVTMSSTAYDTYLFLAGSDCTEITRNDDCSGAGTDSCLQTQLAPGTYFILANSFAAGETGPYSIVVRCTEITFCRDCTVRPMECGVTATGSLTNGDCRRPLQNSFVDFFRLELPAGRSVNLTLRSGSFDPVLQVYSAGCLALAENDDCTDGDLGRSCLSLDLPAGMYFVLVSSYDAGDGGPYELLAECVPRSICNDCERESIACGGTRNGELSGADCVLPVDQSSIDLYDLVLEEETEVTIELASTEFNPFLHLISPACEGIAINDDCTDGSTSSCLSGTFPAGTYIIGANSLNPGEVGDYSLTVRCGGSGRQIGGDCTQDGRLNITDAVCVFQRLFPVIEEVLPCGDGRFLDPANQALLNWNGDGVVDLTDGVSLLNYLFNNGPPHALGIACAPLQGCPDSCGEP